MGKFDGFSQAIFVRVEKDYADMIHE